MPRVGQDGSPTERVDGLRCRAIRPFVPIQAGHAAATAGSDAQVNPETAADLRPVVGCFWALVRSVQCGSRIQVRNCRAPGAANHPVSAQATLAGAQRAARRPGLMPSRIRPDRPASLTGRSPRARRSIGAMSQRWADRPTTTSAKVNVSPAIQAPVRASCSSAMRIRRFHSATLAAMAARPWCAGLWRTRAMKA